MPEVEEQLASYGAAVEALAERAEAVELVPRTRGHRPGRRWIALVAAASLLAVAVTGIVLRGGGERVEIALPSGTDAEDLRRFNSLVGVHGTAGGAGHAGPTELAAAVDLVVTGRIAGFRPGRVDDLPTDVGRAGRPLVTMDVAVEDVVVGELPRGTGGILHVELGLWRSDVVTPRQLAAVAPRDRYVVLYLVRATDNGPGGALPRFVDPAAGRPEGQALWWPFAREGFYVDDGHGGVVRLGEGRELPRTMLADVLPPRPAWPVVDPAPPLSCAEGDGIAGSPAPPGWPTLAPPDDGRGGTAGRPRAPTLGGAIAVLGGSTRTFPDASEVAAVGEPPPVPGYAIAFESLTSRTVAYRDAAGRIQAVFYAMGDDDAGWTVEAYQACNAWYETLPNPASV